jgi:hypothetical protein
MVWSDNQQQLNVGDVVRNRYNKQKEATITGCGHCISCR